MRVQISKLETNLTDTNLHVIWQVGVGGGGGIHLIWQVGGGEGGWRYWNSKLEILAVPSLVAHFFRSPPSSCWFWSIQIFGAPLLTQQFFSEPPFRVSKKFWSPTQYLHSPPPSPPPPFVILNELYQSQQNTNISANLWLFFAVKTPYYLCRKQYLCQLLF